MPKVLIVEDDLMIADMTEEVLVKSGYEVCGIARTVAEAVALGQLFKRDLAIIDLRLADGGLGTEVATKLGSVGALGMLYITGNVPQLIRTAKDGHACLAKPYQSEDLSRSLKIVTEIVETGAASRPFPPGFRLIPSAAIAYEDPSHG